MTFGTLVKSNSPKIVVFTQKKGVYKHFLRWEKLKASDLLPFDGEISATQWSAAWTEKIKSPNWVS